MTEAQAYELAYNAHEYAEQAALLALRARLASEPLEALMILADPSWQWETRGSLSPWIVDLASDVLDEKLEAAIS